MNKAVIWLIGLYQKMPFPLPTQCRYIPTCSNYAQEAFTRYPFLKACRLSFLRILRCHPLAQGGIDPLE